jgi:telomerase reverse transcriptase
MLSSQSRSGGVEVTSILFFKVRHPAQLGVRLNWNVSTDVKIFICSRRYETLTLHRILQGFSISACDWLFPPGGGARKQSRVSVSDALKRRELLEEFLFWYFDSFVLPLLKVLLLLG